MITHDLPAQCHLYFHSERDNMSRRNAAFTIAELTILIVCLITLTVLLLGVFGPMYFDDGRKKMARQMQNSTQVRGIHSGMVLFAQGNNGHYPGVTSDGKSINLAVGLTTQGRVQKLIDDNYITLEYARSPAEAQTGTTSYAMLKIDYNPDGTIPETQRNKEWYDTSNTEASVISDRAIVTPGGKVIYSIHSKTDWRGSVGWNDNHVTFERTSTHPTKYDTTPHAVDDLFTTDSINAGDDAFMVWTDTDTL